MRSFLASQSSSESSAALERGVRAFDAFLAARGVEGGVGVASVALFCDFLHSLFERGLQSSTIAAYASRVDRWRAFNALSPFGPRSEVAAVLRAIAKARPSHARLQGAVPFAPASLVAHLLPLPLPPAVWSGADVPPALFLALRERALFLLRLETLMRAGEPASVSRASVVRVVDPIGREVVAFRFASKRSRAQRVAFDSNYVDHSHDGGFTAPPSPCRLDLCPAHVLDLFARVVGARCDGLEPARRHDALFVDEDGAMLSVERVRTIIRDLLRRAALPPVFSSHSLRAATNQALQLCGVDEAVVALRAGWVSRLASVAQRRHYTQHRLVPPCFVRLLLNLCDGMSSINTGRQVIVKQQLCEAERSEA